ncbi:conserved hypothetical protein [Paecilomyces variotii No. 5]|uniref:Uncharacterized protein n=1 Tax=Byssochlamys spectabilis (strain No. 5 / NBRC 109023) TaxID=1356009 RepID=V5G069_BYSSN|nr:conserved hypothetical protein [Paecilomyces variotii No. 5]
MPPTVSKPRYPIRLDELTRDDIQALTKVLQIDNTSATTPWAENEIQRLIDALPAHLRSTFLLRLVPNTVLNHAAVCPAHKGMNRHVVHDAWMLIKREVTFHLDLLYAYPDVVGLEEKAILRNLRAVSGMWIPPSSEDLPQGAWDFQVKRCEACMLARIGTKPTILRNMRTVLLSRNQMKKNSKTSRLIPWVEAWITQCGELSTDFFFRSGEKAFAMRKAMDEAVKARNEDRKRRKKKANAVPSDDNLHVNSTAPHLERNHVVETGESVDSGVSFANRQLESLKDEIDSVIELYTGLTSGYEPVAEQQLVPPQHEGPLFSTAGGGRKSHSARLSYGENRWTASLDANPPELGLSKGAPASKVRSSSGKLSRDTERDKDDANSEYSRGSWETASISSDETSRTTWTSFYRDK